MIEEGKSFKQYCREAKKRLKQWLWQNYKSSLAIELESAKQQGISESKVKEYYAYKITGDIKNTNEQKEDFYLKVKNMLDAEGEVPDALGRLTDKEYFATLSYDEKQRYTLSLSEKYIKAVERYRKEKDINYKG